MTSLRRLLLDHRALALWLAALALAVRLLVPSGYMVGVVEGRAVLQICSGAGPVTALVRMAHGGDMAGMNHVRGHHRGGEPARADMPCPYAALAQAATTPVDPILLAIALAFVLALGVRALRGPRVRDIAFLRPPLRGPPQPC